MVLVCCFWFWFWLKEFLVSNKLKILWIYKYAEGLEMNTIMSPSAKQTTIEPKP